jgi:hypothetical protein
VVAEVREKLSLSTRAMLKFDMERFSHKKLREVKDKERHQDKISIRFANFKNLDYNVNINTAWESVKRHYQNFNQR